MTLPLDYVERTYAGVLGKLIGVFLGRPFEGWLYDRIMAELGEITYFVNERRGVPLVVTDDDISGTFGFLRALPDYGNSRDLTPEQIGETWLNYAIEERTMLSWAGLGNSTEHTAYLRLKHGIKAPRSGSIEVNTKTVAEQIGAQIFIDGWAMVAPGDPELAVELARKAASVSHDGEAICGAQVIAAMESLAYVERDLNKLLDCATSLIPQDSIIQRMIGDLREWRGQSADWHFGREKIVENYGTDKYSGGPHIVPNHGIVILALLYGDDNFQKSLMIANTCGWDTDCNSGNVGCVMGIKNGLAGIDAGPDWRGPIADRFYLPSADGGRAVTDAVTETFEIVNIGRALQSLPPLQPKNGARFHFELPGSVQGFAAEPPAGVTLENVEGHSASGRRALAVRFRHLAPALAARTLTPVFIRPEDINMPGYQLHASPSLYPFQTIRARFSADVANTSEITCRLAIEVYGPEDKLVTMLGPQRRLAPGDAIETEWAVPDTAGAPIAKVGIVITSEAARADGALYLDYLTWSDQPHVTYSRPIDGGTMWRRAWVCGVDSYFDKYWPEAYRIIQNEGTGLLIQGARDWTDYSVRATINPHLVEQAGIAARVQGMRRYYALLLVRPGKARLVKALDGETVLAEVDVAWQPNVDCDFRLDVDGSRLRGFLNGLLLFDVTDTDQPLNGGGIAYVCMEGCMSSESISALPLQAG